MTTDPATIAQKALAARADLLAAAQTVGAYVVIIGGQAVIHHGYERFTHDVDALADYAHYFALRAALEEKEYVYDWLKGTKLLHADGREIDLMGEGMTMAPGQPALPHPALVGTSGGYADLLPLTLLKLQAGRSQDHADIVNLAKRGARLDPLRIPKQLRELYSKLAALAEAEKTVPLTTNY